MSLTDSIYETVDAIRNPPENIVEKQIQYMDRTMIFMIIATGILTAGSAGGSIYFLALLLWYLWMMKRAKNV